MQVDAKKISPPKKSPDCNCIFLRKKTGIIKHQVWKSTIISPLAILGLLVTTSRGKPVLYLLITCFHRQGKLSKTVINFLYY